ncbi:hypothetical protein ACFV3R_33660 [Streptomyces sp. NPDC059740]|uniref:hypothetical protein n=1 Tax=Streptomyces sp. NPDC059740 TaxID=3346926 RepID=UPI00365C5D78
MSEDRMPSPSPRRSALRRLLTGTVIFLLVAIPAGYLAISAQQSRVGGEDTQEEAMATGLTYGHPSRVQQRTYDVVVPHGAKPAYYYESNLWRTSTLYVQFTTSDKGLKKFLHRLHATRSDLADGSRTITGSEAAQVGWDLGGGQKWAGMTHKEKAPEPTQRITVNFDTPGHPDVYVVSTVKF